MPFSLTNKDDVQAALTDQGYTTARAPNLDQLDAPISSRGTSDLTMGDVQTAMAAQGYTAARAAFLDAIQRFSEDSQASLLMDGTEQIIEEFADTLQKTLILIDLTLLASTDTVVLRQYIKLEPGGAYVLYGADTYWGVLPNPCMVVHALPAKYGFKVTLQQTAGTYRSFLYEVFKEAPSI